MLKLFWEYHQIVKTLGITLSKKDAKLLSKITAVYRANYLRASSLFILVLVESLGELVTGPINCGESKIETRLQGSTWNDFLPLGNHARSLRPKDESPNKIWHW